jgi:signal peptidase I
LAALGAALLLSLAFFEPMIAQGSSMSPAISDGALLVVNRMAYGLRRPGGGLRGTGGRYLVRWGRPLEGDVVVFYTPAGVKAVKRCAGEPDSWALPLRQDGDLNEGSAYFMALGDNWNNSLDSRFYGPAAVDEVLGKVLWVIGGGFGGFNTGGKR